MTTCDPHSYIEEKVILELDLMSNYGFRLKLKQGLLKMENKELILNHHENVTVRTTLTADTAINGRSKAVVNVRLAEELSCSNLQVTIRRSVVELWWQSNYQ